MVRGKERTRIPRHPGQETGRPTLPTTSFNPTASSKILKFSVFSRKRSSELQAEEAEDSVTRRTASGAARQTRATRSRAVAGAVPDATDTATTQTISQPAQQSTQAASTTSSDSTSTASTLSSSSSTLPSLDALVAARIAKMIDNEYDDLVKIARREEKATEANQVAMHTSIWGKMSRKSQERIRMNCLWHRVQTNKDPLALWKAICESHAAFASGDDVYDTNQAWSFCYAITRTNVFRNLRPPSTQRSTR